MRHILGSATQPIDTPAGIPLAYVVGAPYSARSITPSQACDAPGVVRAALQRMSPWDSSLEIDLRDFAVLDSGDAAVASDEYEPAQAAIQDAVRHAYDARAAASDGRSAAPLLPLVCGIGGDHSISVPLITGCVDYLDQQSVADTQLGVIQIDVHHDVRPYSDGPTNGSPFRQLCDAGTLHAENIVQIGIHPFGNRPELTQWCKEHGVQQFGIDQLNELGALGVASQARDLLKHCSNLYLSVDIDALDRAFAPGTVAALPGGMNPQQLIETVRTVCADPRLIALDVVEFDPSRDVQGITAMNVAQVLLAAWSTRAHLVGSNR